VPLYAVRCVLTGRAQVVDTARYCRYT